jgi:hypothetical protein
MHAVCEKNNENLIRPREDVLLCGVLRLMI